MAKGNNVLTYYPNNLKRQEIMEESVLFDIMPSGGIKPIPHISYKMCVLEKILRYEGRNLLVVQNQTRTEGSKWIPYVNVPGFVVGEMPKLSELSELVSKVDVEIIPREERDKVTTFLRGMNIEGHVNFTNESRPIL